MFRFISAFFVFSGVFGATRRTATKTQDYSPAELRIGEQLDFVERNVLNVLRFGTFPQLYNSSYPKIRDCGCYYSPTKILFGTRIGLQCQRMWPEDNGEIQSYNAEVCGPVCNDHHGVDIILFCPHGWQQDCARGCYPPDEFGVVERRVDFWELTLTSLMMYGSDYIAVAESYLDKCGCDGKIRPIRYGTQIGFDCVMSKAMEPIHKARAEAGEGNPECAASPNCLNHEDRTVITFCPAGHQATCSGCEKAMVGNTLQDRLDWMINVISGYARESLELLGWQPTTAQILACNCAKGVDPVDYGNRLGYSCPVRNANDIQPECGPNLLCHNESGQNILHFCPEGFVPSCDEGCSLPWAGRKDEL